LPKGHLAGLRLAKRRFGVPTSQTGENCEIFVLFHYHFTRHSIVGCVGPQIEVPTKKHTWHLSIPAKPCTKSRLPLAKIGGSLEGGQGDGVQP